MRSRTRTVPSLLAVAMAILALPATAETVPLELPDPDGKPGDATKPVKVYILAGQSNMVGMGDISGARPLYPSVFLSADPAIIPGRMPIGSSGLAAHGVYQSDDAKAAKGAAVAIYKGAYDPKADYAKLTPVKAATVALGTVSEKLPAIGGPHTVVVTAFIDVPATGKYQLHAGFEDSTFNVVTLAGKEVYRRDVGGTAKVETVGLVADKRHALRITYFKTGSAAFWMERVELPAYGSLELVTKRDKKFQCLVDDEGKWTVRNDVYFQEARIAKDGRGCPLSATSNGRSIGPELGFGFVMGHYHDEQVLLIKTSMGNRSIGWDFRPPSSGKTDKEGADKWEGLEYRLMVEGVRKTLDKIDKVVPGYKGQGYEIAGFGWFQGHKDSFAEESIAEYERHLVNLINDVRKEFSVPKMPAVVATVGFGGYRMADKFKRIWEAQMAVGDPKKHPEFAGTVASVDIRDFWREVDESPRPQDYHYNRNAETYMLIGDAMGRAMVGLLGGRAEARPLSGRADAASSQATTEPTEEGRATSLAATKPMILDGVLPAYVNDPRYQSALQAIIKGEKPRRVSQFLRDAADGVAGYYRTVGVNDYDWKPFGPDLKNATWDYYSFDPPETKDKAKCARYRKVTYPAGMESWFAADFDAKKAGWKSGAAPFGLKDGKPEALSESCSLPFCGCSIRPKTLWEKEVLLMRQTLEIPALKDGCRYRIVVGGSCHVNAGEGFALYADGELLAESQHGVYKRQGGQPRGAHLHQESLPLFKDGKVTLAVQSFLRYNHPRTEIYPRGHISVWLEEQKLPTLEE